MSTIQSGKKNTKILLISYFSVFIAVLLDQLTKYLADIYLKGKAPFVLIPGVFELNYLENQSAAFSLDPVSILHRIFNFSYFNENPDAFLMCKMAFFIVLTAVVILLLILLYRKIPSNRHWMPLNLIILGFMAGANGNLIDRVVHNYVIDFFYFKLINFPVFNVADIYVTVTFFVLVLLIFFYYKDEDFEVYSVKPFKK